ncbi:MAG: hypothetical protein ABSC20_10595 [Candidatus Bathyarchaeia archaeon]
MNNLYLHPKYLGLKKENHDEELLASNEKAEQYMLMDVAGGLRVFKDSNSCV